MFRNKKKGNILENKFAKFTMRFVFVFLSFFFVLTGKSFAQKIKYKYVFDVGEGHKFIYTVEEETNYQVTNPNRYNILNKELQGWSNSVVGFQGGDAMLGEIHMKDVIGCDLGQDSQKTIYNWCTYLQRKTDSAASRKFMKSLLIMFMEQGYSIKLADSGNRDAEVNYIWQSQQQNASDAVNDNDYPYVWYRDTYFLNCDFKEEFDSKSGGKTPYNRTYLNGNHIYLKKDAGPLSLSEKLCSDKTVLSYINLAIENGTQTGAYFQSMKQEEDTTRAGDTLVWWYREGSYNETEHSILVDCAKNKGDTPLFTFKYSATGELLEDPFYQLRTNENNVSEQFKQFEYYLNVSDDRTGNTIMVYPDFTGGSKKSCKSKFKNATHEKQQTGQFYLACNGLSYAQTGDAYIYVTSFLPDNFRSMSTATGTSYGDKVCSVPAADLNAIILELGGKLDDGLLIKENNGYVFAYDKETGEIHFYKKDDPAELTYVGMNMNLKQMYAPFVDSSSKNTYGISLKADPTGRNNKAFKYVWSKLGYGYQDRLNVLTTANSRVVFDEKGEKYTTEWSLSERKNAMFFNLYEDADIDCLLSVRDLTGIAESCRGDHEITTIPLQDCPVIAEVSIRDWLEFEYKKDAEAASKRAKIASEGSSLASALKSIEETREEMVPFIKTVFKYARPVILFLLLIAVCMTAIYSILFHNDPEKRAIVKIRLKNIAVGIIFFSVSALIIALCIEYFDKAADLMFAEDKDFDLNIVSPFSMDKNWLLKLILNLIGVIANAIKWVIDFLATRMLRLSDRELNLATCIFEVDRGGGISLYPFEQKEWDLYMFGYRMLTIIAIAFIAVAIVKNVIMILVGAGNAEKVTLVRQDFLRIFIAIMCVVFVPYGIRLMLTLVNSMVQLIPVSASMFNLDFSTYNELEPVCNLIYYIIEIKVYLAFTVRKVMIAFLIISTPAIFGIWAVSDKFRSFDLWLGELFTNIFMQFTYGFAFFFLVMIISNNKNPLVLLMMLSMLIKLADFVKESLQGLFTQWGGINETGIANQAYDTLAGAPAKVWGMGKKVTNNVGKTLVKASKQYDKTGTTVAAKRVHNAGMILQGNIGGLRTERDRLDAIKKRNKIGAEKKLRKTEAQLIKEIETEMPLRGNVNSDRMYMKAREGTLTQDEIDNLRREGGLSAKIADYASTRNEIKENEKEMKALGQQIDSLGGLSALQGSVSKETLANLKAQSGEANNNVAEIYEHTLDEFDRLEDKMYKTIEKVEDPSTSSEDRTKEQANLKTILEQVIDKAQIISEVSVELNMTGGAERMEKIRNAQSSAVREKANRFDKELKTEAMDSIQATQDNLETLENREKSGENAPKIVKKKSE